MKPVFLGLFALGARPNHRSNPYYEKLKVETKQEPELESLLCRIKSRDGNSTAHVLPSKTDSYL